MKLSCPFCVEASVGTLPDPLASMAGVSARIVMQSDHFLCVPSVCPLQAGHVLVFPKEHAFSLRCLDRRFAREMSELVELLDHRIRRELSTPFYFEHGTGCSGGGCGIDHAHLHILPLPKLVARRVEQRLTDAYDFSPGIPLAELLDRQPARSYLAYGFAPDELRLADNAEVPSQYVRRILAEELNLHSWDWHALDRWEEFRITLLTLGSQQTGGSAS